MCQVYKCDPDNLAALEADMWVAYYSHHFLKLGWLLFLLNKSHFWPHPVMLFKAAYYSAMAAVVFRKTKGHENEDRVIKYLELYYKALSDFSTQPFDYKKTAQLEYVWWMIDRYPTRYKTTRADGLAAAMAVMYKLPPQKLRVYGQKRAEAMELLGDYHHDTEAAVDWPLLRRLLHESYHALLDSLNDEQNH